MVDREEVVGLVVVGLGDELREVEVLEFVGLEEVCLVRVDVVCKDVGLVVVVGLVVDVTRSELRS